MGKGLLDPKVDFVFNFKYLKTERFHTGYRLKEIETNEELTDIIEMHFIEIPKLEENSDEKDMLVAWTEFLKNPETEKVRNLEMTVEEIRRAKDQLVRMSNDTEQREIYEMRAKILKDKVSALNKTKEEGREEERERVEKEKIEKIESALKKGYSLEIITEILGVSIEEVENVKKKV